MRLGVLGAMQIDGGVALRPRSRTVLAALVVGRGRTVSAEELADAVWGEDPPRSWPKQVQYCIWDLRKSLGPDVIETVDRAYRLRADTADLDVAEFEALIERGRAFAATGEPDRAASTLGRALVLWRGRPFESLDGWMPGRHETARLEELRRSAEEALVEARLAAGDHRDAVVLAERHAAEEPLRERRWGLLALAQYRSGNQAAALRTLRRARQTLREELGIDPGAELVALESAILAQDPTLERPAAAAANRCPYKGLAAFDAVDREVFFGRDGDVARCLAGLDSVRLLVVSGPSGCGKSSIVRAGIVPALRRRGLDVAIFVPGADPDTAWSHALASTAGHPVVVVDQLEELFAGHLSREAIRAFCARLATYADQRAQVIVTVRSDHLSRLGAEPALARLIEQGLHLVGPLAGDDVRATIEGPAAVAGLRLEAGLVDLLIHETEGEPAALPLLSHALAETWRRRDGRVLTVEGYRATGEIRGAVARSAEQLYASLPPEQQSRLRSLVLRLVVPTTDGEPILAHLDRQRLTEDAERDHVLDLLIRARLVTADETTVALAHEAVARAWPRMRAWLDDDVAGQRLMHHLSTAADDWDGLGRPDSDLYRGARLESALEWRETTRPDLTNIETAFLDTSAAAADNERRALASRARRQARQNRRLRWSMIGLAGLLVVAIAAAALFVRQRDRAEHSARDASARALASHVAGAVDEDPELAMLLGLEAIDATDAPLAVAVSALHAATQSSRLEDRRAEATGIVDVSRDRTRMVTGSKADPGALLVWDVASRDLLATLSAPAADLEVVAVRFHPDSTTVAASYSNDIDGAAPAVVLWDPTSAQAKRVLSGDDDAYFSVAFSNDGRQLVTISVGGGDQDDRFTLWDAATGAESVSIQLDGVAGEAEFLPDDTAVVVGEGTRERVGIYSSADGSLLRSIPTPGFESEVVALNASTGWLALGSQASREVRIVDFDTGRLLRRIPGTDIGSIAWSPDGDRLSVAGANQAPIRIFDIASGADPLVLSGHKTGSWDAAFIGNDRLASVGQFGELRVWDVSTEGPTALGAIAPASGSPWSVDFSPDGIELLVGTSGQTIERLSVETGERLAARDAQLVGRLPFFAPVSADGRFIASTNETDGLAAVLDARTLDPVAALPACTTPRGLSSDGSMVALDGRQLCLSGETTSLAFNPPAGADLRSRIIAVTSGREVLDFGEVIVHQAVFNPQGLFPADRYVALIVDLTRLELYDVVDGRLIGTLPAPNGLFKITFDPSGRWLAASTGAGEVFAIDMAAVAQGTALQEAVVLDLVAHEAGITGIDISPNGTLATIGLGEEVRLWDLGTGELLIELQTHPPAGVAALTFGPDGSYLLYTDGAVLRRYPLNPNDVVQLARRLVTRDLTRHECATFLIADCP